MVQVELGMVVIYYRSVLLGETTCDLLSKKFHRLFIQLTNSCILLLIYFSTENVYWIHAFNTTIDPEKTTGSKANLVHTLLEHRL